MSPEPLSPLDSASVNRVRDAITDLMRCRPEDWPELLPGIAATACNLDPWCMDLMADTAVHLAATASRLAVEAEEEEPFLPDEDHAP